MTLTRLSCHAGLSLAMRPVLVGMQTECQSCTSSATYQAAVQVSNLLTSSMSVSSVGEPL